jgi:hypothetical protein
VKQIASQIREDIIYPPQNIIEFEFSKEVEDFRFVSKLSQWEQIRMDEAQAKISEWVDLIEKGLEHNKSVFFDDFGTFSKDKNKKIVFQGMIISHLNIENEGLEPVILPQKNNDEKNGNVSEPVKDKRIILNKKKRKRDTILFRSIIFAAVLLLCALFFKEHLINIGQTVYTKVKTMINSDVVEDKTVLPVSETVEEEPVTSQNILPKETQQDTVSSIFLLSNTELYLPYQKGNYYIIAGSFVKEESALLHIKQKKLDKYNAKLIIHPESTRIRVCVGVADNEEEATRTAAQLDKNYWILK